MFYSATRFSCGCQSPLLSGCHRPRDRGRRGATRKPRIAMSNCPMANRNATKSSNRNTRRISRTRPAWWNCRRISKPISKRTILSCFPWAQSRKRMISKNWSRRSVLVCGISLLACALAPAQTSPAQTRTPAIALIDAADAAQWQTWTKSVGWQVITAAGASDTDIDARARALAAAVAEAVKNGSVDPTRAYLAGRNEAAAAVFYTIARIPDRWAAGVALGGSPKAALESNRVFSANFTDAPVLWASSGPDDEALAQKLKTAGLNLEWRSATGLTNGAILQWLSTHTRDEFPLNIDCETNSPAFASCYLIQMTRFDAGERNDVLPLSVVAGESAAALDLGGFGYHVTDPGPGVPVVFLRSEEHTSELQS